jgi:regulator of PEP synthase PpsR (kinase-PPPase family)
VDFTLAHDDGQRANDLPRADVVLVGVSRVSKSVTCFFLACRGIRAANVPLSIDTEPPAELLKVEPRKVVLLTTNVRRLQAVREARDQRWRGAMQPYTDQHRIARELAAAEQLAARYGWQTLDVSYKAVEEAAAEIVDLIHRDRTLPSS